MLKVASPDRDLRPACQGVVDALTQRLTRGSVEHIHVACDDPFTCLVLFSPDAGDEAFRRWISDQLEADDGLPADVRLSARWCEAWELSTGEAPRRGDQRATPPRWKSALLVLLGLYPLLVLSDLVLGGLIGGLPFPLRAAIVAPLLVAVLTFGILPPLSKHFSNWLSS